MDRSHIYIRWAVITSERHKQDTPTATRLTAAGGDQPPSTKARVDTGADHPDACAPWFSSTGNNGFPFAETHLRGSHRGWLTPTRMRGGAVGVARRPPMISNATPTTATDRSPLRAGERGGAIAR